MFRNTLLVSGLLMLLLEAWQVRVWSTSDREMAGRWSTLRSTPLDVTT